MPENRELFNGTWKERDGNLKNQSIPWSALQRTALVLLLFFAGYLIVYLPFGNRLDEAGRFLIRHLGYPGVFIYVFLVDTFIVPATADIIFVFTPHWNPWALVLTISVASILGGFCGFLIGRSLSHFKWVTKAVDYYRERGTKLISRYGAWGVAMAAFTPLPYSTVSWIAGMLGLPANKYLLASLLRIPRFALYYAIFRGGTEALNFFR
jgi:membrane protein YqaA with SNARE-associated domain